MRKSALDVEGTEAGVLGSTAEFFLDAEQLVILGNALAAAGGTGLDLAGVQGNGQVSNGGVLGLAGTVRSNGGVASLVGHLNGLQRLRDRTDLVQLDQDGVAAAQADALGQALSVGDEQVVAHQLVIYCQPSQSSSSRPSSME